MNSPSSSSTASPPLSTKSLLESVAAARAAGNERGLDAFLARAELAKVGLSRLGRLSKNARSACHRVQPSTLGDHGLLLAQDTSMNLLVLRVHLIPRDELSPTRLGLLARRPGYPQT